MESPVHHLPNSAPSYKLIKTKLWCSYSRRLQNCCSNSLQPSRLSTPYLGRKELLQQYWSQHTWNVNPLRGDPTNSLPTRSFSLDFDPLVSAVNAQNATVISKLFIQSSNQSEMFNNRKLEWIESYLQIFNTNHLHSSLKIDWDILESTLWDFKLSVGSLK